MMGTNSFVSLNADLGNNLLHLFIPAGQARHSVDPLENRPNHVYARKLRDEYNHQYEIASQARSKGMDPSWKVESETTYDLAERVEKAVGPVGVAERIRELRKQISREETALKVAEEIVLDRFGTLEEGEAATQALRTALAVLDEAVTVAPIQGIHRVVIRANEDRTRHLAVYFAGPMRAAGGTEMGLTLIVADHIRRKLNLQPYRGTEQEARRFVEELRMYERMVNRFQYRNSDDVLRDAVLHLPIEPNGVETDPVEVAVNRNLARVETNRVRGGALRVVNDGLLGRAQKVLRIIDRLGLQGWDWLRALKAEPTDAEEVKEFMFMEDVVGGRPIFAFPGEPGGFRIRYGRARNTGLASIGLHPSTMEILGGFPAIGVQMKLERPGKAGVITAVDSIEPPVVKLQDGSIVRTESPHEARTLVPKIAKILFLGDMLVGFGEFLENNKPLTPSGFVEEWWAQLVLEKLKTSDSAAETTLSLSVDRFSELLETPLLVKPIVHEAIEIAKATKTPLHPRFSWFWERITLDELWFLQRHLREQLALADASKLLVPRDQHVESILEKLCLPLRVVGEMMEIGEVETTVLRAVLGTEADRSGHESEDVMATLSALAGFPIERKTRSYVGGRMGRPEKAKERAMTPRVHALFPTGQLGGARRDIVEASKKSLSNLELVDRICTVCDRWEPRLKCRNCGGGTVLRFHCLRCGQSVQGKCPSCNVEAVCYRPADVDLHQMLGETSRRLGLSAPIELVKGVKGLINKTKTPEPIEKGILRAKWDVSVFKDGTLRYDASNAVLTHFRPGEIGLSLEKARNLGYEHDMEGKSLSNPEQLCQMEIQDLVVTENCGEYMLKVSKFLDDLLQFHYALDRFYMAKTREDLIGHLVVGLSPHTSVGVIGRIVGFTKASVCYAHPLWHAAKRRDCDGDEDSVSLLIDVLLNFSREYLPDRIGGLMDAPLLLAPLLNPVEVARQAFNIETENELPLEFYRKSLEGADPKEIESLIPTLNRSLESPTDSWRIGFTHPTEDIDRGRLTSSYKELPTMLEKVTAQLNLADITVAVRGAEVARKVLSTHILRDLVGNLRTYTSQRSRCVKCGAKPRRVPLGGKCRRCGGKLTATVFKNGVEKYLSVASEMVQRYNVGPYYTQRLELIKVELSETFRPMVEDREQQKLLVGDYA